MSTKRNDNNSISMDGDDLLSALVQWVEDFEDYFEDANERCRRDRDYYDGRQWSEEDAAERESLGRTVITVNRIARKVRFMKGYEAASRTSPEALPRTPAHEKSAEVVTEGLRYLCDLNRLNEKFSDAYENLVIEGSEALEVTAKPSPDGTIDPAVNLIPWDRFIYDPFSREKDFSDARYIGITSWFDLDDAIARWPDKEDILRSAINETPSTEIFEDRPQWNVNISDRDRLRLVQLYFKQNKEWMHSVFCKSGFIEEPAAVVFTDEYGKPECPIIAGSALINRDNERYGFVREMIDVQDEINVRHSNDIDFSKMRQTTGERGAVSDVNKAKRELQKPNGHVEVTPNMRFEILPTNDMAQNNLQALELARQEIDLMGPNASMLGKDSKAPSGRAILASQEGGTYELSPFMTCHSDVKKRVYKALWHRIKQFWNEEKWIRVTDDQGKPKFVGINVPETYADRVKQQNGGQIPPEIAQQYGPALDQPTGGTKNDISYLDMDIVISEVPQSVIIQQEQFDNLVNLAKMAGPGAIPIEAIIEASALRDKDKILKRMEESQAQQAQGQQQQMEAMAQKLAAEIEQSLASARKQDAEALKTMLEAQFAGLSAQTYQMQVPPMQPPPGLMQPQMMTNPIGQIGMDQEQMPQEMEAPPEIDQQMMGGIQNV